jgi:hypothetical protein
MFLLTCCSSLNLQTDAVFHTFLDPNKMIHTVIHITPFLCLSVVLYMQVTPYHFPSILHIYIYVIYLQHRGAKGINLNVTLQFEFGHQSDCLLRTASMTNDDFQYE